MEHIAAALRETGENGAPIDCKAVARA